MSNLVGQINTTQNLAGAVNTTKIDVALQSAGINRYYGKGLEFVWDGTRLGVRREGETEYIYTDLKPDGADKSLVHDQLIASKDWYIVHNMDKYPSVAVVDSAGTIVIGEIEYLDSNTLVLHFSAEFAGKAYLN